MNAKMPELKRAFEAAGFSDVRTLLSSGNVVFSARKAPTRRLELRAEKAMQAALGRSFGTFIRPAEHLQGLIEADPFAKFGLSPKSKRVVTFLREAHTPALRLPIERDDASILAISDSEVLCAYVPGPKGPAFMALLERTFGATITTRTLDTVRKCALA
jgi:uncharacterized protein (DUF1697 family)